jgi:hypothetical protein
MKFFDSHTQLFLVRTVLGLGGYFLFMRILCQFLAYGEESDKLRSQFSGPNTFLNVKSESANRP